MWGGTGHTYFHALSKYKLAQIALRGMTTEQFDSLRIFVATPDERVAHDSGMTLGQLMGAYRDDDALELAHPGTGRRHAVVDIDKQLADNRITFTVDPLPSPE